jgi:hypothetical protein
MTNDEEKTHKKCLNLLKEHIEYIEQQSYLVLTEHKSEMNKSNFRDVYDAMYNINQKAHQAKKAMNIYSL